MGVRSEFEMPANGNTYFRCKAITRKTYLLAAIICNQYILLLLLVKASTSAVLSIRFYIYRCCYDYVSSPVSGTELSHAPILLHLRLCSMHEETMISYFSFRHRHLSAHHSQLPEYRFSYRFSLGKSMFPN